MRDEAVKLAAMPRFSILSRAGRYIAEGPTRGGLLGAGVGAATGAGREFLREDNGQPRQYGARALQGGILGGLAGATAGAGAQKIRDIALESRLQGMNLAREVGGRAGKSVVNFGARQLHGLTGWKPEAGLGSIGIEGKETANKQISVLRNRIHDDQARGLLNPDKLKGYHKEVQGLRSQGALAQQLQERGMTSIPGLAKSMVTHPIETTTLAAKRLIGGGTSKGDRALALAAGVGIPLASGVPELTRGDERGIGGKGVGEKVVGLGADVAGGLLTPGLPVVSQAVAGMGAKATGEALGRRIDRRFSPQAQGTV